MREHRDRYTQPNGIYLFIRCVRYRICLCDCVRVSGSLGNFPPSSPKNHHKRVKKPYITYENARPLNGNGDGDWLLLLLLLLLDWIYSVIIPFLFVHLTANINHFEHVQTLESESRGVSACQMRMSKKGILASGIIRTPAVNNILYKVLSFWKTNATAQCETVW